jgi:hypothetical protein
MDLMHSIIVLLINNSFFSDHPINHLQEWSQGSVALQEQVHLPVQNPFLVVAPKVISFLKDEC